MSQPASPVPPQKNVVTLRQAINRTMYWRDAMQTYYGCNPLPHGLYIRMKDIMELSNLQDHFPTRRIKGVRIYFTFRQPQVGAKFADTITALLVPVYDATTQADGSPLEEEITQEEGDMPEEADMQDTAARSIGSQKPYLLDLIEEVEHLNAPDTAPLDRYVSVYDVTSPCPPACDSSSPLFGRV